MSMSAAAAVPADRPASNALRLLKGAFISVAAFSGAINMLMLSGSVFMLQVYDRVLPSRSLPTLVALFALVTALYAIQSALELVRSRLFARIGRSFDLRLSQQVFQATLSKSLGGPVAGQAPFRDLEQIRNFLSGAGPGAVFDLPWLPIYLFMMFLLHPLLGLLGVAGAIVLTVFTVLSDRASTPVAKSVTSASVEALSLAEQSRRSAETIIPLGMGQALSERWAAKNRNSGQWILRASDIATHYGGLSRFFRMALQSAALGLGAYLIINGHATGGVMIASSILLGRALAPVELVIAHWRGFLAARQSLTRLDELLAGSARLGTVGLGLPRPKASLAVNQLAVVAPGTQTAILKEATFALEAGDSLGVLGPSGSGKSTLLRTLVGLHTPARGAVRLDGSTLDQWAATEAGRFIGYLPQQVELFGGTIAENISRFEITPDTDAVLAAATLAGVDALIRGMPQGFDTPVGEGGGRLSAGQRQRIALARALYRDPFLLVLDEPNSALDVEGEAALTRAIVAARARGAIVVAAVHRVSGMEAMNKLLILGEGVQRAFGPSEEVLRKARAAGQGGGRLEVVPSP